MVRDVQEFLEDPRPAGKKLFAKQRSMGDLKEYDADGYSTRAVAALEYPAPSSTELACIALHSFGFHEIAYRSYRNTYFPQFR